MVKIDLRAENKLGQEEFIKFIVPHERQGQRLDHYLVEMLSSISRSRLSNLIRNGFVLLNNSSSKAGNRLMGGDIIEVTLPPPEPLAMEPEKVNFEVLHEDDDLLVIAKPPGVVVHPASGHQKGTLVHGLLAHCDNLSGISGVERPGIVHRLDKDTSGVMVIAKSDKSHQGLVELFKARQVKKVYRAIVVGRPATQKGCISGAIGRHQVNRKKMAVLQHGGREAVTCWSVLEEFAAPLAYLEVRPETGRTHQIRVHMAHSGHPVAGDALYGSKQQHTIDKYGIKRQCLHAYSLSFTHPVTGKAQEFISPVWPDIQAV
ncbi:MAG: RluA family pseudouridine synthase, partial [Desulfobulbaceae bacterium]|nr:RluA family pseudouridine synthase [Desulfobulbaceae bacterium]